MPYADPEKRRAYGADYRAKHKAKAAAYNTAYRAKHKDELRAQMHRYRVANRDRLRAKCADWHAHNREQVLLLGARKRAEKAGVPFDLTLVDIDIPDVCPVLGIPINMGARGCWVAASPSLDRHVPSRGYVRGNVVVMSHRANALKSNATFQEIEALYFYMRRTEMLL